MLEVLPPFYLRGASLGVLIGLGELTPSMVGISIVIPLFNHIGTIAKAVSSVFSQLTEEDEIVIINDGSTDGGLPTIECLSDRRVSVLHQTNSGVSIARNRGLAFSRNRYVAFLDADDYWLPGALHELRSLIVQSPEAVLYCFGNIKLEDRYQKPPAVKPACRKSAEMSGERFIKRYAKSEIVTSSTVCVAREALEGIGGFPEKVAHGEDIYVWLRLALSGIAVCSSKKCAIVVRGAASPGDSRPGLPYAFQWFIKQQHIRQYGPAESRALRLFLKSRSFRIIGAAILEENRGKVSELVESYSQLGRIHGFTAGVVARFPPYFFFLVFVVRTKLKRLALRLSSAGAT